MSANELTAGEINGTAFDPGATVAIVRERNRIGKHLVIARNSGRQHKDRFDVDDNTHLERFIAQAGKRFGFDDGGREWLRREIIRQAAEIDLAEAEHSAEPVESFTLKRLKEENPTLHPYVIDGVARQGEVVNIISHSKAGKSWAAYALGLSVVIGQRWLDTFKTSPGPILLIDNELHRPTIAYRIYAVADALGIPQEHYEDDFHIWPLRGRLHTLNQIADDLAVIPPHKFRLIIFDAKYRFALAGVSENDNAADTLTGNLLDEIADHTGAALVLVHHTSKGDQGGKRVTDVGAGAGAQSRYADSHLILREHEEEGVAVLEGAVRSFAPFLPLAVRWQFPLWVPDHCIDTGRLKGRQTRQEEKQQKLDLAAIDATAKALEAGEATARKLRRKTGFGESRQDRALSSLLTAGRVEAIDNGDECETYRLIK